MKKHETHVVPGQRGGWEVVKSGARETDSAHRTKKEAENRARELLRTSGGGEVVVHGRDGMIKDSDSVPPSDGSKRRHSR